MSNSLVARYVIQFGNTLRHRFGGTLRQTVWWHTTSYSLVVYYVKQFGGTLHRTVWLQATSNSLVAYYVIQMQAKQTHVHPNRTVDFTTYLTLYKIISNLRLICMA